MPHITIRITDHLYNLLLPHGDIAETTRAALHAYLGRSPDPLEARLTRIEQRLAQLADLWQTPRPPPWPPEGRQMADTYLGKLCARGHDHESGMSRRYKRSKECVDCSPIDRKERRLKKAPPKPS